MNNLLICKGISKNSCSFLAFLLFTFILIAPAAAQTLKEHDITLRVQNEPVESVFNKISKQTNFKFLYDQETVNKAPRVSFDIKNASNSRLRKKKLFNVHVLYKVLLQMIKENR